MHDYTTESTVDDVLSGNERFVSNHYWWRSKDQGGLYLTGANFLKVEVSSLIPGKKYWFYSQISNETVSQGQAHISENGFMLCNNSPTASFGKVYVHDYSVTDITIGLSANKPYCCCSSGWVAQGLKGVTTEVIRYDQSNSLKRIFVRNYLSMPKTIFS